MSEDWRAAYEAFEAEQAAHGRSEVLLDEGELVDDNRVQDRPRAGRHRREEQPPSS